LLEWCVTLRTLFNPCLVWIASASNFCKHFFCIRLLFCSLWLYPAYLQGIRLSFCWGVLPLHGVPSQADEHYFFWGAFLLRQTECIWKKRKYPTKTQKLGTFCNCLKVYSQSHKNIKLLQLTKIKEHSKLIKINIYRVILVYEY
jgi:hypothetical protein